MLEHVDTQADTCITSDDFVEGVVPLSVMKKKISALITLNNVDPRNSIKIMKYESKNVQEKFFEYLCKTFTYRYTNLGKVTLEEILNKVDVSRFRVFDDDSIQPSDVLGNSLDYKSIHDKIKRSLKKSYVHADEVLNYLKLEPFFFKPEFIFKIRDLNIPNYKGFDKTKISTLLDALREKNSRSVG